jgi:predicted AlkP superfamily phosphohydrolase/phosphomutase
MRRIINKELKKGRGLMARINLVQVDEAEGVVKKVFDEMEKIRGKNKVSNLFKAYAKHPQLLRANWTRMKVIMGGGCLTKKMKETIAVNLAVINKCNY